MNHYLTFNGGYPTLIQSNEPQGLLLDDTQVSEINLALSSGDIVTETPTGYSIQPHVHVPRRADVNHERDRRIHAGVKIAVRPGVTVHVGGDETTKINLLGLAQAATLRVSSGDVTTITKYRDETNTVYDLTPPEILQVWSDGAAYVSEVFAHSWALKDDPNGIPVDYMDDKHWP